MKKWFLIAFIALVAGCSSNEQEETPPATEVSPSETEEALQPKELVLASIEKWQQQDAQKYTVTEQTQHHPDLDLDEQIYSLMFAPAQAFLYKQYEDNYHSAKYEAYALDDELYVKNELGDNTWETVSTEPVNSDELINSFATMIQSIVEQSDEATLTEESGEQVLFLAAPNANFKELEQLYHEWKNAIHVIAAPPSLSMTNEEQAYNFTNATFEMRVSNNNELNSFMLQFDFSPEDNNFKRIEYIFQPVEEVDFTIPEEVIGN